jgi:hypothetical protein
VNRGLRVGEPAEQMNRAILARLRQRRSVDGPSDLLQAPMLVMMRARRLVMPGLVMVVAAMIMVMVMMRMVLLIVALMMLVTVVLVVLVVITMDPKLGGRDPGSQHPLGRHDVRPDREAPERGAQAVEREAEID